MRKRLGLGLGLNFNMRSCFQIKWAGFRTTKITSLCGEAYYTKQKRSCIADLFVFLHVA
jgi:hypothetical protein